jgi:hypothetical protein
MEPGSISFISRLRRRAYSLELIETTLNQLLAELDAHPLVP